MGGTMMPGAMGGTMMPGAMGGTMMPGSMHGGTLGHGATGPASHPSNRPAALYHPETAPPEVRPYDYFEEEQEQAYTDIFPQPYGTMGGHTHPYKTSTVKSMESQAKLQQ